MSTNNPTFRCLLVVLLGACLSCRASVIIVDTFDRGEFAISIPPSLVGNPDPSDEVVNLPLGQRRIVSFSGGSLDLTGMISTVTASTGTLAFFVSGTASNPNFPLRLNVVYSSQVEQSIADCTEFILGFSQLSGVGTLYVELGGSNGLTGVHRVDLTGPGEVRYPVSGVYANGGHSLDAFTGLKFTFEARSPEFSFILDEIRLIPEPSTTLLALAAAAGLLARRRKEGNTKA